MKFSKGVSYINISEGFAVLNGKEVPLSEAGISDVRKAKDYVADGKVSMVTFNNGTVKKVVDIYPESNTAMVVGDWFDEVPLDKVFLKTGTL